MPGDKVKGEIPLDMIELYKENGSISDEPAAEDALPLTIEAFTGLNAAKQKEELERLGIEPASREDQRIEQYTSWLNNEGGHGDV